MAVGTHRKQPGMRNVLVVLASILAFVSSTQGAFASPSVETDATPRVNGPVYAIAQVGDLTIIGGEFTMVGGKPRSNAAAIRADGTLDPTFNPSPDGVVRAIAGSADGSTVFLGGRFDNAGGAPRANLAAVDTATGTALSTWQVDTAGTSPGVRALAIHGNSLYVAGTFSTIQGKSRASLAAVDAAAGEVLTGFRSRANSLVRALALSPDGTKIYAAGAFSKIGGADRTFAVAELMASTGDATAFNPQEGSDQVLAVGLSPDGSRLYYSTPNNYLFAYDVTSDVPVWVRKTSGDTQAIAVSGTEVYIGGHFSQIVTYKIKRNFLASLRPEDGTVTDWNPDPIGGDMGVWAITLTPTSLMAGGTFTTVNGTERVRFARFPGTP